jgi:hypothetical protein
MLLAERRRHVLQNHGLEAELSPKLFLNDLAGTTWPACLTASAIPCE